LDWDCLSRYDFKRHYHASRCLQDAETYAVRYDAVKAVLLNEFLKEHKRVDEQQTTFAELKSTIAQQQGKSAQLQAQAPVFKR
jgi:hypothetical protein